MILCYVLGNHQGGLTPVRGILEDLLYVNLMEGMSNCITLCYASVRTLWYASVRREVRVIFGEGI